MRLTAYTDFSLRVLMYLAARPDARPTISEIAATYGISKNHLMKVVHELGAAGYVKTIRGKNGGLQLGRAASEIGIGDVVRHAEPDMALAPCLGPVGPRCAITPACKLRGALAEAGAAFMAVLDRYTLADLTGNKDALLRLLDLAPRMTVAEPVP
jgi:Rrf2 family transcriptional regulator, nitric oxide-sensitive transcriptional repressor